MIITICYIVGQETRLIALLKHFLLKLENVASPGRDPVLIQDPLMDTRLRTALWPTTAIQRFLIGALALLIKTICFIDEIGNGKALSSAILDEEGLIDVEMGNECWLFGG